MERLSPASFTLVLAAVLCACSAGGVSDVRAVRTAIVYGDDDRLEPFEIDDVQLQQLAGASSAAIVLRADLARDEQGRIALLGPTAGEAFSLCPDERFAAQPSAALCSAVLVAPDVALTAGHCLSWMSCARLTLVFGHRYTAPDRLRPLQSDDVYECSELLSLEVEDSGEQLSDYAFVRLDRTVARGYAPVPLQVDPGLVVEGSAVTVIGHAMGLPTKVARSGVVVDERRDQGDYFRASIDNFVGGSGSGVFDQHARLLGIAARGELDFALDPAGCHRAVRVPADRLDGGTGERVVRLEAALDGLCAERPESSPCAARGEPRDDAVSCRASPPSHPRSGTPTRAPGWLVGLAALALLRIRARNRRRSTQNATK